MTKSIPISLVFIVITAILIMATGVRVEEEVLSLSDLIDDALTSNRDLRTKENQVNALQKRIDPAGALPDPMLKLDLLNVPEEFDFNNEPMTQKQIGITQKVPFPGKLGLKETIAEDEYLREIAEYEYRQLEIVNEVKITYFSLFFC